MSLFTKQGIISQKAFKITIFIMILAVLFYIVLSIYVGKEGLLGAFASVSLGEAVLVLVVVLFGWFLRGMRWNYYLAKSQIKEVSFWKGLKIFFASFALTLTPGKAGELVKGYFLKETPFTKTAGILFAERLMDLVAVLVLAIGFIFFDQGQLVVFLIAAVLTGLLVLMIFGQKFYQKIISKLKNRKIVKFLEKIFGLFAVSKNLFKPDVLFLSLPVSILAWFCEGLAFYLIARFLYLDVALLTALFIYAIATVAGAVSMIPGGFLSAEATMFGLLALQGIMPQAAIPLVLLFRFATVWCIPLVGFGFMLNLIGIGGRHRGQTSPQTGIRF